MSSFAPSPLRHARQLAGVTALVALGAAPAAAQVTFEELATDAAVSYVGNCVASGGLTFTAVGLGCDVTDAFSVYGSDQALFYSGSAALFNNLNTPVAITSTGGTPFSLSSLTLTPGQGLFAFEQTSVMFTAALVDGGTAMQTVLLAGMSTMPMNITLSGFTDVLWVRYETTAPSIDGYGVQIDNLVLGGGVAVVPEPGTVLLLGSGLAGLAVFARRRHRR